MSKPEEEQYGLRHMGTPSEDYYTHYRNAEEEALACIRFTAGRFLSEVCGVVEGREDYNDQLLVIMENRRAVALAMLRIADEVDERRTLAEREGSES